MKYLIALKVKSLKPKLKELREFCSNLWIDTFNGEFWMSEEELSYIKSLKYKFNE